VRKPDFACTASVAAQQWVTDADVRTESNTAFMQTLNGKRNVDPCSCPFLYIRTRFEHTNIKETRMRALLLLPFIGLLWVPFYNQALPSLFGFPFFYWYQLAWVPLTSLLIWIVYRHELKKGDE